jgi:hypothetical protein
MKDKNTMLLNAGKTKIQYTGMHKRLKRYNGGYKNMSKKTKS